MTVEAREDTQRKTTAKNPSLSLSLSPVAPQDVHQYYEESSICRGSCTAQSSPRAWCSVCGRSSCDGSCLSWVLLLHLPHPRNISNLWRGLRDSTSSWRLTESSSSYQIPMVRCWVVVSPINISSTLNQDQHCSSPSSTHLPPSPSQQS